MPEMQPSVMNIVGWSYPPHWEPDEGGAAALVISTLPLALIDEIVERTAQRVVELLRP